MFLQPPLFEEKVHLRVREQPLCSTNPLARWVVEILAEPVVCTCEFQKASLFFLKNIVHQSYLKPFVKTVPPHCVVDTIVSYYCIYYAMRRNSLYFSGVLISLDEIFSKIQKKPSILQKWMIPHMNGLLVVIELKQKQIFFNVRN